MVVVLSRCGPYPFGDAPQTLQHELSHILLPRALGFAPPRWFDEGLAMRVSAEWGLRDEWFAALALPAVAHGSWHLDRVEADFAGGESEVRRSYALAKGFVRDLFRDDADLSAFLAEARRDGSVDIAFRLRFGTSPDGAFRNWAKHLPWWGAWVVALSSPESALARGTRAVSRGGLRRLAPQEEEVRGTGRLEYGRWEQGAGSRRIGPCSAPALPAPRCRFSTQTPASASRPRPGPPCETARWCKFPAFHGGGRRDTCLP